MFPAANRFRAVYTKTDYIVWYDRRELVIRVGERCASIEHLLSRFKTRWQHL
jgi:hypothetical protein